MLAAHQHRRRTGRTASRPPLGPAQLRRRRNRHRAHHRIKLQAGERRANDAVVAAGRHLIAVKEGQPTANGATGWTPEFNMSDRTAH